MCEKLRILTGGPYFTKRGGSVVRSLIKMLYQEEDWICDDLKFQNRNYKFKILKHFFLNAIVGFTKI